MRGETKPTGNRRIATGAVGIIALLAAVFTAQESLAYSDVGDRVFVSTVTMPQIAPGDDLYLWPSMQPQTGGGSLDQINFEAMKSITERLAIVATDTWQRTSFPGAPAQFGFANLDTELKYLAIQDQPDEFLLTFGLDYEWGGTGAQREGASPIGATTPRVYFGKGFVEAQNPYLRPFALTGFFGEQIADATGRPNQATGGLALEYSIPYLEAKVQSIDMPDFFRHLTPLIEADFSVPEGRSFGVRPQELFGTGVSYAGEGWDVLVEALIPGSRATAGGAGVVAQLHISLSYFFGETIGRPLFSDP